jgi:hypothetical protein
MKLTGQVGFRDIDFGVWVLQADDGAVYEIAGADRHIKQDGKRVEVEGTLDERAVSAAMVGPILRVKSYRFL